jgi:hypothetical protein
LPLIPATTNPAIAANANGMNLTDVMIQFWIFPARELIPDTIMNHIVHAKAINATTHHAVCQPNAS